MHITKVFQLIALCRPPHFNVLNHYHTQLSVVEISADYRRVVEISADYRRVVEISVDYGRAIG